MQKNQINTNIKELKGCQLNPAPNVARARLVTLACSISLLLITAENAWASSFINPANGNRYFLTNPDLGTSWADAQAQAMAAGGYLVTINDADEQQWLNETFQNQVSYLGNLFRESYWIGLYDPNGTGSFEWVNGEPVTYTNWAFGEPNYLGIERSAELNPSFAPGQWNNRNIFASEIGGRGIVEISRTIPEPSSNIEFFALGALGVYLTFRRTSCFSNLRKSSNKLIKLI